MQTWMLFNGKYNTYFNAMFRLLTCFLCTGLSLFARVLLNEYVLSVQHLHNFHVLRNFQAL